MDIAFLEELAIALNASPRVPRDASCRLCACPETWLGAPPASRAEIARRLGVATRTLESAQACAERADLEASAERDRAHEAGAVIVTRHSPGYPAQLLDLELPPPALYVQGKVSDRPGIAIVGSRKADPYGLEAAQRFGGELASVGLTIVSGLALGVDSAAHRGALAVGGYTVAVLGCGIDVEYPRSNRRLRAKITESGAVVSEFPIGTTPEPHHFPIRNRIIAALGCGTLVIRGTPRSGSLITVGCALTLGRLVWAVPGNIFDPRSMGPNSLIRDGAHPAQSSEELLETLPTSVQWRLEAGSDGHAQTTESAPERSDLARLYHSIPPGQTADASALATHSGLALEEVLGHLVELEIMGFVTRHPGPVWCRSGTPGIRRLE